MPKFIARDKWTPKDVKGLETAAMDVVRSSGNALVIAGPGAGKTELLAQRACYLLETGACPAPKRILAISFKRDAAKNLADRVDKRVAPDLASRFDSLTFDAFAKGLVDRFRPGIPEYFRPGHDYALDFDLKKTNAKYLSTLLNEVVGTNPSLTQRLISGHNPRSIYTGHFIGKPLVFPHRTDAPIAETIAISLWQNLLKKGQSLVNFEMIGRLADLMLRHNPEVLRALRTTYAFVFLDEFQDTSGIHYDLTKTAFQGSGAVLTAVGDEKQRIMVWAGALEGVFEQFKDDFNAAPFGLKMNYRSAPELVRIQTFLIRSLEPDCVLPEALQDGSKGDGECRVLNFIDHNVEAAYIANLLKEIIEVEGIAPRDICVLTRQLPDVYSAALGASLQNQGVTARVEEQFQGLLAEPAIEVVLHFFKLLVKKRAPESWGHILELLSHALGRSLDDEDFLRGAERKMLEFRAASRAELDGVDSAAKLKKLVIKFILFFGARSFKAMFPQYSQGSFLRETVLDFVAKFFDSWSRMNDWAKALEDFEGLNSVPIMTIHKSKGLEYHTVIFLGLEDYALWGFQNSQNEETCAFFVALSRAKTRVIFTFCHQRPSGRDGVVRPQRREVIDPLYQTLLEAGIEEETITTA